MKVETEAGRELDESVARAGEGEQLHDGLLYPLEGCPRARKDCTPLARRASEGFASYMCCGETAAAPVPSDNLRLCVVSTHRQGPVDVLVNFDARDCIDVIAVLSAGLSWDAVNRVNADPEELHRIATTYGRPTPESAVESDEAPTAKPQ